MDTPNPDSTKDNPLPDQIFDGSTIAIATNNMWKLAVSASVSDYRQDMFVAFDGPVPDVASSSVGLSDSVTVTQQGGTGVYSLQYIFSLDGSISATMGDADFCVSVIIPQSGTNGQCWQANQVNPDSFPITFTDLQFGTTIDPTIWIQGIWSYPYIAAADVPAIGAQTLNGSVDIEFGSTVRLTDVLVLDSNGDPIPGVTIDSAGGFQYPLDPANQQSQAPEPGWMGSLGLCALAVRRCIQRNAVRARG